MVNEGNTPLPYEPYYPAGDPDFYIDHRWYLVYIKDGGGKITTLLTSNRAFNFKYGGSQYTCGVIDDIDRQDSTVLKIVEIPLPPFPIEIPLDTYYNRLSGEWSNVVTYNGKTFPSAIIAVDDVAYRGNDVLLDLNEIPHYGNNYTPIPEADILLTNRDFDDYPDPKLLNSEFSELKIIADSYALQIKLENFELTDFDYFIEDTPRLRFNYYVPDNYDGSYLLMASRDYDYPFIVSSDPIAHDESKFKVIFDTDYDLLILSDKAYEVPVYTSDYLQYVNYGYKYDKQKLDLELQSLSASSGVSLALAVAGAIGAGVFGGPLGLMAGIGGVAGTFTSGAIKYAKASTSGNLELQQKLAMLKAQSGSVAGNSKSSLLYRYNAVEVENQTRSSQYSGFRWQLYQPRKDVMKMLDNLFYLFGYACDEIGIPDYHTKRIFDFIQCEADFKIDGIYAPRYQGLTIDYINEAKEKFREGVTIIHDTSPVHLFDYDDTMTKFNFDSK